MAYDEQLAERVRDVIIVREGVDERRMFGGLAFLLNGHMACGIIGEELMVRLPPEDAERAIAEQETVRPMDFTGRPLRGMVYVEAAGVSSDQALAEWVEIGADHAASLPPKQGVKGR